MLAAPSSAWQHPSACRPHCCIYSPSPIFQRLHLPALILHVTFHMSAGVLRRRAIVSYQRRRQIPSPAARHSLNLRKKRPSRDDACSTLCAQYCSWKTYHGCVACCHFSVARVHANQYDGVRCGEALRILRAPHDRCPQPVTALTYGRISLLRPGIGDTTSFFVRATLDSTSSFYLGCFTTVWHFPIFISLTVSSSIFHTPVRRNLPQSTG